MAKVLFGMNMSLDGFVCDANGSSAKLSSDYKTLMDSDVIRESMETTGAVMMGRKTFEMAADPDDYADSYEYQVPIFVITSNPPVQKPKENDKLRFTFTDDIQTAVQQAKEAAGDKDVTVVGGPTLGQQLLRLGLVDVLQIDIMPVLYGDGTRLFDKLQDMQIDLEKTRIVETGQRTSFWFNVKR